MNLSLSSVALTAVGAYATYSGLRGVCDHSRDRSKAWEMAKVALGAAILANQVDLALGGEGLIGRILNPSVMQESENVSSSQPSILMGSKPEDFDPMKSKVAEAFHMGSNAEAAFDATKCNLDQVNQFLQERGENSGVSKLFQVLKSTKGMTCENHLPWKDSFHAGGTGYIDGIQPSDLDQSVMWGIDSWKRPFIAIKHTCDKVEKGVVTYFQRYTSNGLAVKGGQYRLDHCLPSWNTIQLETERKWLDDLLSTGSAKWFGGPYVYLA